MSNFPVSANVARMRSSSTLKAAQAAADLREKGFDVIDLTLGEPDFDTPGFIKEFAVEGLVKGLTKYTPTSGLKTFKESIAAFYAARFGTTFSPAEVAAVCGGKQGLFNAACALIGPGDDVLVPQPYWVTFPEIVNFCGARNVFVDTLATDFVLSSAAVKAAITDRTKLLIINSPNNPTGRVVPSGEFRKIVEACAERNVFVLADECYLFFVYPPAEVFTAAALPDELRKFVCVAGSFSKTYAMTGWRIGYTIAAPEWTNAMVKLQSHSATHPTSFVQYACARAMREPDLAIEAVDKMLTEYKLRRDWFIPALREIDGLRVAEPEGAFYAFVDVRSVLGGRFATSADLAQQLLENAQVVTTDGAGFGLEGFLRLSYATSLENLKEAVVRIKKLLGN